MSLLRKLTLLASLAVAAATARAISDADATPFLLTGPEVDNIDPNGPSAPPKTIYFGITQTGTIADLDVYLNLRFLPDPNKPGAAINNYIDNLKIVLTHDGISIVLYDGKGDTQSAIMDATFDDGAAQLAPNVASVIGTFKPIDALSAFKGIELSGAWQLAFFDHIIGDGTDLAAWSLSGNVTGRSTPGALVVPEPSSLALLFSGLSIALLCGTRRRSRTREQVCSSNGAGAMTS